jgi:hypothetical protein
MYRNKIINVYSYVQGDSVIEKKGGGEDILKNFGGRKGC